MAMAKRLGILALFCCSLFLASECQNDNTTAGVMQKTSFSCSGRPAGYYADIETGCQVYHMCDGLGRQFSYTCPNTTLFQQRMLICDHWYMVNCSKAESNYAANLLIGQRDKPFVNDEENNLRTPRPDLLDRPYAPDYSGESFRSQYKQLTATQNQIRDESDKSAQKLLPNSGHTRWRIPPPSRTILPPAYEPQIEQLSSSTSTSTTAAPKIRQTTTRKAYTASTAAPIRTSTARPRPAPTAVPQRSRFNEALHPRKPTVFVDTDDLGTSHSTRYNTSADFNSAEQPVKNSYKSNATKLFVKPPSKIYEPPFLFPIYNQEEPPAAPLSAAFRTSTAAPFSSVAARIPAASSSSSTTSTTTIRTISRPTTYAGSPFSTSPTAPTTTSTSQRPRTAAATPIKAETRTPTPAQSFRLATPTSSPSTQQSRPQKPQLPASDLLPPFVDFVQHDIATTQGPPIYYEWKVPATGLELPKLDPPIGVDGREYPETINDYNVIVKGQGKAGRPNQDIFNTKLNDIAGGPTYYASSTAATKSFQTRVPNARSIKAEAPAQHAQRRADFGSSAPTDITQLRKELLIPEYAFPLESIGRTGYAAGGEVYNSFQLKIPERRSSSSADAKRHWFGENPKCPECHPSFVIPGTCEPCLQR